MPVFVAELLGTFVLALGVGLSVSDASALPTAVIAGLTLGTMVYVLGSVSGCHINPAVTVALWSRGSIKSSQAVGYVVAQLIGGLLASAVSAAVFGRIMVLGMAGDSLSIVLAEAAGAFMLVLGVTAVVDKRVPHDASGLAIGSSLLLGILIASHGSAGIANPAVAVGLGSISVSYILGPIVGGIAAAALSKMWLKFK